ncbi:MAG: LuxR C-terminal-related transcriptional regulator [Butyrivibrio sp.]|nr:LuxR C-terminal-related transcriptional regulator [Butyrivibrio sp.]
MPKRKWNLNTIYISERLQEVLRPISYCALTTVVAPMGYGKTTAINWYLSEHCKTEKSNIIRISVYSGNLMILWKSVQDAFSYAGYDFLKDYPFPSDEAGGSLLADTLCHELGGKKSCYIFIDDFHLMTDHKVSDFICLLVNRLPENVHLIVASRDRFLPAAEILRLGNNVYQIGIDNLRLNHTELAVYAHRCGSELSDDQINTILYSSEGWFSAVYLNLCSLFENGFLPDHNSDIYSMFTQALIDPLPDDQKEFLAVMGLADEFNVDMAEFVTQNPDSENLIKKLTEKNAFVTRLHNGGNFRFHHMMKECAERAFNTLPRAKRDTYRNRYGKWYEEHSQYIHAIESYRLSQNYDALLDVVKVDAGILLSAMKPELVLSELERFPRETLKAHPLAILVLMRCMFNWHLIPKMLEYKALFMESIAEQPDMDPQEKGNLLGECDLITSFLMYNDISAMSNLHRSASRQMSRAAISLQSSGGWTFGSPSVLMMFHREPGAMEKELSEMDDCMPHYYRITNNHGHGAEKIMRAEAYMMQGRFFDAQIELESAYAQSDNYNQKNMTLCCDFVARRLSLVMDLEQKCSFEDRYKELIKHHNISYLNIWNAICAYHYALMGDEDKIPGLFSEHRLSTITILAPGKPMYEMIENQVYLLQGAYAQVIGRNEGLLGMCRGLHYSLVAIHMQIQNAAAYEKMGKRKEATEHLKDAIHDAMADNILFPFVENYHYIKDVLDSMEAHQEAEFISEIKKIGKEYNLRKEQETAERPAAFETLTDREYEIVTIMRKRMSNKEIAQQLYLSEGSVKQYVNQIYSKLSIQGDRKNKRQQLFELFDEK